MRKAVPKALVLLLTLFLWGCGDSEQYVHTGNLPGPSARDLTLNFVYNDDVLNRLPSTVASYDIEVYASNGTLLLERSTNRVAQLTLNGISTNAFFLRVLSLDANGDVLGYSDFSVAAGAASVVLQIDTLLDGAPPTPVFSDAVGDPVRLAFLVHPEGAQSGAAFSVSVVALDATGRRVNDVEGSVTLALSGGSSLSGTTTQSFDQNGVAQFNGLSVAAPGADYFLTASTNGLSAARSLTFSIGQVPPATPVATALDFTTAPGTATVGQAMAPAVQVTVRDQFGQTFDSDNTSVTLALATSPTPPAGGALGGTLTATTVDGVATFSNLTLSQAGTYRLTASATGLLSGASTDIVVGNLTPTNQIHISSNLTDGNQETPAVTADSNGNFVFVWESYKTPLGLDGIFARRIAPNGTPINPIVAISNAEDQAGLDPVVAALPNAGFVVAWIQRDPQSTFGDQVLARAFDANNQPLGSEIVISDAPEVEIESLAIASDSSGRFVATWAARDGNSDEQTVQARRYDSNQQPLGVAFLVNSEDFDQYMTSVAVNPDGSFAIVWVRYDSANDLGLIFGQRYLADGTPNGTAFEISEESGGDRFNPRVGSAQDGRLVVVYERSANDTLDENEGVAARLVSASGIPQGTELLLVPGTDTADYDHPDVAVAPDGSFTVSWSFQPDGAPDWVQLSRYTASGTLIGSVARAGNSASGDEDDSRVALNAQGVAAVVWNQDDIDGDEAGVYASLFPTGTP